MHALFRRGSVFFLLLGVIAFLALAGHPRDAAAGGTSYLFDDTAAFGWMDISGTGTNAGITGDDDLASGVPIGFTFTFEGTDYTALEPTSNGVISLDQEGNTEYANEALPTSSWAGAALFPWWDDLDPSACGDVYYETVGSAPNRAFVVQWNDVCHVNCLDCTPGNGATFEVAVCEGTNNVVFQYLDTFFESTSPGENGAGTATIGIQGNSADALQYSFNMPVLTDNMAIVFYPAGGSPVSCVAGAQVAPTETPTVPPATPTGTPAAPTATVAVALPSTGAGGENGGGPGWLIVSLAGAAAAAATGYVALRVRARRR